MHAFLSLSCHLTKDDNWQRMIKFCGSYADYLQMFLIYSKNQCILSFFLMISILQWTVDITQIGVQCELNDINITCSTSTDYRYNFNQHYTKFLIDNYWENVTGAFKILSGDRLPILTFWRKHEYSVQTITSLNVQVNPFNDVHV